MKSKIFFLSLVLIANISIAQTKQINFDHSTFAELKAKAKKENKLIFIDAYTTWCGPCKWMAKEVFTNDTVADYYNAKFINAKIDMEKGEGIDIAKLYEVNCYPNLLFVDGEGKLIHRTGGAMGNKDFIAFGEATFDTKKTFSSIKKEYEAKKTESAFLLSYLKVVSGTCLDFEEVVKNYFATQKEEELISKTNWEAIMRYSSDYQSKEFVYLLGHLDEFKKVHTEAAVDSKINNVLLNSGYDIINKSKKGDSEAYKKYRNEISKLNFPTIEKTLFTLDMGNYQKNEENEKRINLAIEKGDKYFVMEYEFNDVAWAIYEQSNDKAALLKAEEWMKKVVASANNEYAYQDTYAAVLYKLKKKQEAKVAAIKAIDMAKESGMKEEDYKPTSELLEKIEKLN